MLKTCTLLFVSLLTAGAAMAQSVFPLTNVTWTQRHGQHEASPRFTVIGVKSDNAVIGGKTYRKVYQSETDVTLGVSAYVGGLREDVANKRVYYYELAKGAERLIYDFSLAVGDTIFTGPAGAAEGIVHSVDMAVIGGLDRKRITFRMLGSSAAWTGGEWVEGIGNTGIGGLLGSPMAQPTCDCGTATVCYSKDGSIVYHNGIYSSVDCDAVFSPASVGSVAENTDEPRMVPNPVKGDARLLLPAGRYNTLSVLDVAGRIVAELAIGSQTEVAVQTAGLPAGVYVYRLARADGATETRKFIISE